MLVYVNATLVWFLQMCEKDQCSVVGNVCQTLLIQYGWSMLDGQVYQSVWLEKSVDQILD